MRAWSALRAAPVPSVERGQLVALYRPTRQEHDRPRVLGRQAERRQPGPAASTLQERHNPCARPGRAESRVLRSAGND